ncbi:hypothetical protein M408DRAFT_73614 [Serendipita vermifera MAFF 305830]|uniref:Uncharacterized protein n=1 Tax=Serendipita vermifera MAFF 305830 TaxID=933852 RepID=A0A0C2WHL1_SERVB|nr:hypothetical protein M408DRAFT_73614 [Serendipita vermifera MAFF 305830]
MVIKLKRALKANERARWCRDGHRFLQYHQIEIELGSINVHRALAFTPKESLTHKYYYNKYADRIPSVKSGIPSDWLSHQVLSGHISSVECVAFSPDGTRLVSGSADRTLRLWDGVTDPMEGHTSYVTCVAFSPDGTRVVSGSYDNTVRLWDGVTGASIGDPMEGHTSSVEFVAFSPDGTRVVSGSWDNTLRLWNSSSCAQQTVIETGSSVFQVQFSTCGFYIVSEGRIWDITTSIPSLMKGSSLIASPSFFPIRFNSTNHTLEISGYLNLVFPLPNYHVTRWAAYKGRIVLGSEDGRVMLIDCTHLL